MKLLLSLFALSTLFAATSCRTSLPLDPMTMKQSCRCLPHNFSYGHVCAGYSETTVTSAK